MDRVHALRVRRAMGLPPSLESRRRQMPSNTQSPPSSEARAWTGARGHFHFHLSSLYRCCTIHYVLQVPSLLRSLNHRKSGHVEADVRCGSELCTLLVHRSRQSYTDISRTLSYPNTFRDSIRSPSRRTAAESSMNIQAADGCRSSTIAKASYLGTNDAVAGTNIHDFKSVDDHLMSKD